MDLEEGTPAERLAGVLADCKVAVSAALPHPLFVIVVLADHLHVQHTPPQLHG